jgi:cytochrome c-type biogenesis protein CcmE
MEQWGLVLTRISRLEREVLYGERMSRKLLAGTVLLGAGILTLVFGLSSPRPVYASSVSDFLLHPVRERTVRLSGTLVPGSLSGPSASSGYSFRLADRRFPHNRAGTVWPSQELSVHCSVCVVPDTFRDLPGIEIELSVEGELCAHCHRFEASLVMAKCPGVYRMNTDAAYGGANQVPACLLK